MAPKPRRPENKPYPTGWHWHHGALYYWVPRGLEAKWDGKRHFRLGKTEAEAYRTWAERLQNPGVPDSMGHGFDRYVLTALPSLSPSTQRYYTAAIEELRPVFGDMSIVDFRAHHAYRWRDIRKLTSPKAANRGCEFLSSFFRAAGEWGIEGYNNHPLVQARFKKLSLPARTRIVEQWEIDEALTLEPPKYGRSAIPMMQAYIRLKGVTGRRRIEILRLRTPHDLLSEGVRFQIAKQRNGNVKYKIVEWSDELRAAIDAAIAARPVGKKPSKPYYKAPADISPWIFCKWDGTPYLNDDGTESDAFGSAWGRFMDALLKRTNIKERFWDSDLRAKASDDVDIDHAQKLLDHVSQATTRKHYRRRPEKVKPVR